MNFNEFQKLAKRTAKDLNLTEFALGLGGKAGECQEIIKKVAFHGHELDDGKLIKELGDVLWYLALLAETIGVELEEVAKVNIEHNSSNRKIIMHCSTCRYQVYRAEEQPCVECNDFESWEARHD